MDAKFPKRTDGDGFAHFNHEVYKTMFREITVFPYETRVKTITDNIYGEDTTQKWPEELSYVTPAYLAELPYHKSKIQSGGVDEDRPLTLYFDKELIQARNQPLPAIGYLVFVEGEYYRILQDATGDYFANLYRTYTHVVLVQRYRTESVGRGDIYPVTERT